MDATKWVFICCMCVCVCVCAATKCWRRPCSVWITTSSATPVSTCGPQLDSTPIVCAAPSVAARDTTSAMMSWMRKSTRKRSDVAWIPASGPALWNTWASTGIQITVERVEWQATPSCEAGTLMKMRMRRMAMRAFSSCPTWAEPHLICLTAHSPVSWALGCRPGAWPQQGLLLLLLQHLMKAEGTHLCRPPPHDWMGPQAQPWEEEGEFCWGSGEMLTPVPPQAMLQPRLGWRFVSVCIPSGVARWTASPSRIQTATTMCQQPPPPTVVPLKQKARSTHPGSHDHRPRHDRPTRFTGATLLDCQRLLLPPAFLPATSAALLPPATSLEPPPHSTQLQPAVPAATVPWTVSMTACRKAATGWRAWWAHSLASWRDRVRRWRSFRWRGSGSAVSSWQRFRSWDVAWARWQVSCGTSSIIADSVHPSLTTKHRLQLSWSIVTWSAVHEFLLPPSPPPPPKRTKK